MDHDLWNSDVKEIWIFQHEAWIGAGYLGDLLKSQQVPHTYFSIEAGDAVPDRLSDDVAALVFLGGTMSVNDPLPWIKKELRLIQQAEAASLPMLGHCLGSQLISKALGGTVKPMANKEIGWHPITREDNEVAKAWFSGIDDHQTILIWHHEEFSIPPGATSLYRSDFCQNQAFARGNILATVAHIELNIDTLREWLKIYGHDILPVAPSIQPKDDISYDLEQKMRTMHILTNAFYTRWFQALPQDLQVDTGASGRVALA